MKNLLPKLYWVLLPAMLVACGDDAKAPAAAAPAPAKAPAAAAAAAATPAAAEAAPAPYVYQYNPLGKRDPFRPTMDTPAPQQTTSASSVCNEPLCQFDRDSLKLVAVVTGEANPVAMVEDHSGVGYVVRRNTKVGKQGGKVTQILHDCIIVTEYWTGPDGKANPNPTKMCITEEAANPAAAAMDLLSAEKSWQ